MKTVPVKKRGENWSNQEKEILRNTISKSLKIIENKSTKSDINIMKNKEWQKITQIMNKITGKQRTTVEVKLAWKRMKMAAKAAHRQEEIQTGGGEIPPLSSPEDIEVVAIAPFNFEIEVEESYDSDGPMMIHTTAYDTEIVEPSGLPQPTDQVPNRSTTTSTTENAEEPNVYKYNQETIVENDLYHKKRSLEMMETEHKYSVEISKLKIEKLKIEIAILRAQRNSLLKY